MITKKEMNPKDLMKTRMYLATIRKQFIRKQHIIQNTIADLNWAIADIDSQMENQPLRKRRKNMTNEKIHLDVNESVKEQLAKAYDEGVKDACLALEVLSGERNKNVSAD